MLKELIKLANHLDSKGLNKEASYLDEIIKKAMDDYEEESSEEYNGPLRVPVPTMKDPVEENSYDRYFEEDLQPIIEEYDEGAIGERSSFESEDEEFYPNDEEYKFNVSGPHTKALRLEAYDFFPEYPGTREEFLEDVRNKNPRIMDYFQARIMSQDLKENRRRRRRQR